LLDPQVTPSVYYPSKDDMPGTPAIAPDPVDPAAPFKRELDRVGAEASVHLVYWFQGRDFYLKILRFATPQLAEKHWLSRRNEGNSELVGFTRGNLRFTGAGQELRPGLKARWNTVECKEGKYVVRLSPALPSLPRDPGTELLVKQREKIIRVERPD
jgi:hypothetical protein